MFSRRTFLKDVSLVALAPTVPALLKRTARAAEPDKDGRILVVVQLDGGNDGINTVVPLKDDGYASNRKKLRLPQDRLLKVNDDLALHPSLRAGRDLLDQRQLAIVQGVGYPNPNRSHDVSMAIWQTARVDRDDHTGYGWIGRALDDVPAAEQGLPNSLLIGTGPTPRALWGRRSIASSFSAIDDLVAQAQRVPTLSDQDPGSGELSEFLRRSTLDAYSTADTLADLAKEQSQADRYPNSALANRLKTVARLIRADLGTRVYYAVQPGYDTHASQLPVHARLLRELAGALEAFLADLQDAGLDDRVLVMCFSEFGRRVKENASAGTDHGTAGPVFLAGNKVKAGVHGQSPSLQQLKRGDLEFTVDFRSVYATLLERWLELPAAPSLGGQFDTLDLIDLA